MKRSDIKQPPCYFDKYIDLVPDVELADAFRASLDELDGVDVAALDRVGDNVYAPGKWTVKDILQHLIDAEHVLSYRALRIGRNDKLPYTGFDEAEMAANVSTANRTVADILDDLRIVRKSTAAMFATFTDEAVQRFKVVNDRQMSALAFGFSIIGHQKYHLEIIREMYVPLD